MIEIKQLTDVSMNVIHKTVNDAFSDYVEPFDLTIDQLRYMIERRGCDLNLSFGAFSGTELVGFTLNGVDNWNGKRTAYDTGTGIIKEYRKQGIATKMFEESLPVLRSNGIEFYLLEVIRTNTKAFELYKKAGFKVIREFDYYDIEKNKLRMNARELDEEFEFREIQKPDWQSMKTFWEFEPSWQNCIDSINRKIDYFKIFGIFKDETLAGYGIIEPSTGDIPQLAVANYYRREGLGTNLLKLLVSFAECDEIRIINTEAEYEPFKKFAKSVNLEPGFGQYEMGLDL
ncbi:MAG: GNAT family N-acetyltransferase [Ignavibacteriae bacterium]|nr:GNAT family N-acetyltransferase [Ignavibacteriota bacterium]NOG98356.1 GNAT family N-acetyltransferase [Ignavibacteriota bacterium]